MVKRMTLRWDDRRKKVEFVKGCLFSYSVSLGPIAAMVFLVPNGPGNELLYKVLLLLILFLPLSLIFFIFYRKGRELWSDEVLIDSEGIQFSIGHVRQWRLAWGEIRGYEEFWKNPEHEPRKAIGGTGLRLLTDLPGDHWFLVNGNNSGDIPDRKRLMAELDTHLPADARKKRVRYLFIEAYRSAQQRQRA